MSLRKFERIENWDDLNRFIQDLYNNLGIDDLRASGVRQATPTSDAVDKGRIVIEDTDSATKIHYRKLDGTLKSVTLS